MSSSLISDSDTKLYFAYMSSTSGTIFLTTTQGDEALCIALVEILFRKRCGTGALTRMPVLFSDSLSNAAFTHYWHVNAWPMNLKLWQNSLASQCVNVSRISSDHPMCLLHADLAELGLQALWTWHQTTSFTNLFCVKSIPATTSFWNNMAKN